MSSLGNAEMLLGVTFGHLSGQIDQYLSDSNDFGARSMNGSSSIEKRLERDVLKYEIPNFVTGDIQFIQVLIDYAKDEGIEFYLNQFDIDNSESIVGCVKKQIEKSPAKYLDLGQFSRGVRQYAEALLSQEDG